MDGITNEYIRGTDQVGQFWTQSQRSKAEIAGTCAEEGQWICWIKDAEYGAAKQEENKTKVTEVQREMEASDLL